MSKQVKVGDRVFKVEEKVEFKGHILNQTKGSGYDLRKKSVFCIGQALKLPSEGESGSKVPNKALSHLSVSDASQIWGQLMAAQANKIPSAEAVQRAQRTIQKARGF